MYEKWVNRIKFTFGNNNCLDRLGECDYNGWDYSYISETKKGIKWIMDVRSVGSSWTLLPKPSRFELYPNMSNDKDYPWTGPSLVCVP